MNDYFLDGALSHRLKRATAEVARSTPLRFVDATPVARRRAVVVRAATVSAPPALADLDCYRGCPRSGFRRRHNLRGVTLLQSVTQGDPDTAAVYRQNLGETLALSQTRNGVSLTIERAYADVNRVMITYAVNPHSGAGRYMRVSRPPPVSRP